MSQSAKGPSPQEILFAARRGRAASVRETALGTGLAAFARAGFSDPSLILRWPEIAGEDVARIASPLRLQEGQNGSVLTLACDGGSAVFLQHQTRALTERLNAFLGQSRIERIRCVPGTRAATRPLPSHPLRGRSASAGGDAPPKLSLSEALLRLTKTRETMAKTRGKRPFD